MSLAVRAVWCGLLASLVLLVHGRNDLEPTRRSARRGQPPAAASRPRLIVVLGSSTSAGTGPEHAKNAWVPRYQAFLADELRMFTLSNLAVGGQTTYHVQPTGYVPPPGRPAPVTNKNITAALALAPDAVIVNLPSNDAAEGISLAEQMANYDRVVALARDAGVAVWVSTSQPRNFDSAAQTALLTQARDAITARFAPRVLDFWTPLADASGKLERKYDAGDGVHVNDEAHAILERIVEAAKIPEAVLLHDP